MSKIGQSGIKSETQLVCCMLLSAFTHVWLNAILFLKIINRFLKNFQHEEKYIVEGTDSNFFMTILTVEKLSDWLYCRCKWMVPYYVLRINPLRTFLGIQTFVSTLKTVMCKSTPYLHVECQFVTVPSRWCLTIWVLEVVNFNQ